MTEKFLNNETSLESFTYLSNPNNTERVLDAFGFNLQTQEEVLHEMYNYSCIRIDDYYTDNTSQNFLNGKTVFIFIEKTHGNFNTIILFEKENNKYGVMINGQIYS